VSDSSWIDALTTNDFYRARRRALVGALSDMMRGRPNSLVHFDDLRRRVRVRGQRYLGHQTVDVDRIIGSEGRYDDFDRHFLPRHNAIKTRWRSIDRAHHQSVHLPPVDLYKIGDVYFVKDGNHRVSVAREHGQHFIDAYVTELIVDVPLDTSLTDRDLLLKEEYSDFLEWTGLHDLRPDERIEFSESGGYLDLVRHINGHRYYLGLERGAAIPLDEAVASWYDNVYLPIVEVIRNENILKQFPQRTEADLYRWIMDHRAHLRDRYGADPGAQAAARDYVATYGQRGLAHVLRQAVRGALDALPLPGKFPATE
jgi:hypothetical protein